MSCYPRRSNSRFLGQPNSSYGKQNIIDSRIRYPHKMVERSSRPATPRKNSISPLTERPISNMIADQVLRVRKPENPNVYQQYSKSPLKQSLSIYDINSSSQRQRMSREIPGSQPRISQSYSDEFSRDTNYGQGFRVPLNPSRNYADNQNSSIASHRSFAYLSERDRPSANFEHLPNACTSLLKEPLPASSRKIKNNRSPLRTPRKSEVGGNPLIEKSEMLKQRIHKLKSMAPQGENLKNHYYEVERCSDLEESELSYRQRETISYQSAYMPDADYLPNMEEGQNSRSNELSGNSRTIAYEEGIKEIENLGKKINDRLKGILNRHKG